MTVTTVKKVADLPLNQIIAGECIEVMRSLPEGSVDLTEAELQARLQALRAAASHAI